MERDMPLALPPQSLGGVILVAFALALGTLLAPAAVLAQTPQASLNNCEKTVKVEAAKYIKKRVLAVATCLQKVSGDVLKSNIPLTAGTARTCATQFRKIVDSRSIGVSLEEKKIAAIAKRCQPGSPGVLHTLGDVTGTLPSVAQPINTNNINTWCQRFGGDGSIDTVAEWLACLDQSHDCAADTAISTQYPRALEWFGLVKTAILALPPPPASDPNKYADAVAAVTLVDSAIEGSINDNIPGIQCGSLPPPVCSKACCYIEQPFGIGGPTSCLEYQGSSAQVSAFIGACTGKLATPGGSWKHTGAAGACSVGPMSGVACSSVTASNWSQIPKDSACP